MKEFNYEYVKDPKVFAINRLPAHSDHVAYKSFEELQTGVSSFRISLDGVWQFHYAKNIKDAPEGFWETDFDLADGTGYMFLPTSRWKAMINLST